MLRPRLLLAAALLASLAVPAVAADKSGAFAPRGIGIDTCKDLVDIIKANDQKVVLALSWFDGYLTAFNTFREGVFDVAPWQRTETVVSLIANHCDRNPEDRIAVVAAKLIQFMSAGSLDARSEFVVAKNGDKTVRIYSTILKRAQEQLVKQGFLKGPADGSFGPKTQAAFEQFQTKAGIAKSGLPDQETLARLLLQTQPGAG